MNRRKRPKRELVPLSVNISPLADEYLTKEQEQRGINRTVLINELLMSYVRRKQEEERNIKGL